MSLTKEQWVDVATQALRRLLEERSALVRPEADAILGESDWVSRNLGLSLKPQPHIVTEAHARLVEEGALVDRTEVLNKRSVKVWVDANGLTTWGRKTEVERAAATKRRLYRRYLGWAGNTNLCGNVAEQAVDSSLRSVAAAGHLSVVPAKPGHLAQLPNREKFRGPLDAGGYWPRLRSDHASGVIPFAVEVKNIRNWIYPRSSELWGLLTKLSSFPDVVPVLIARRIHPRTFLLFKAAGVLGYQTRKQWFSNPDDSPRHRLTPDELERVANALSFRDMTYLAAPTQPQESIERFFADTPYKKSGNRKVGTRSLELWQRAAPIVQRHSELRDPNLSPTERSNTLASFTEEIERAGLDTTGWASYS